MHTGIDLGLNYTAIVTIDDDYKIVNNWQMGSKVQNSLADAVKEHPMDRFKKYYDLFDNYVASHTLGTIVLEEPMGAFRGYAIQIAVLKGVYLTSLSNHIKSSKLFMPTPSQIKKFWTRDGGASKYLMCLEAKRRGYYTANDHQADALAMSFMGLDYYCKL